MELALDTPRSCAPCRGRPHLRRLRRTRRDADLLVRVAERDRVAFELALPSVRPLGLRARAAAPARPAACRGRGAGDLHRRLALGRELPAGARPCRAVALRRRAERDHRPAARAQRAACGSARLPSGEAGPADLAEASFVSWRVHRALEELPDKEREVVELAYWSGLSQSEVAEYLHIPLGTVKTRTRSALARLADLLEGELA